MGDNREELKEEDWKRSFPFIHMETGLIICAGPFFNLFLSLVLLCFTFLTYGIPQEELPLPSKIGGVSQGLPAEKAGLKKGDTVVSLDGVTVSTWNALSDIIRKSEGKEIAIQVKRDEEVLEFKIKPEMSKEKIKPGEKAPFVIGITAPLEELTFRYEKVGVGEAISKGIVQTWFYTRFTVVVVAKMITGEISRKMIGGPIEIARQAGKQGSKGLPYLLGLMVLLGVNLGLLNLFPILFLDGGHLLFCL
jgi:regulator of sigma E protease